MIKLNDDNILVGQIKQFLHDFNLPKCSVVSDKDSLDKLIKKKECIYQDNIYKEGKVISHYIYNKQYLNLTTNLKISNMQYDRYTHRYLGRYLRFLRDYKKINLLSLYNYFDEESLTEYIEFDLKKSSQDKSKTETIIFDPLDQNFMYYQIPVMQSKYSLFMKITFPIEGCLTILNLPKKRELKKNLAILNENTYFKTSVPNSYLIDFSDLTKEKNKNISIADKKIISELLEKYSSLVYLVLKVPKNYANYIVLLEGDYINNISENGFLYKVDSGKEEKELIFTGNWFNSELNTYFNNFNYLLSDKIIQYITGNVISPLSEDYDIIKMQSILINTDNRPYKYLGYWSDIDLLYLKEYIAKNNLQKKYDILGYVDSDVEKSFLNIKEGGIV